MRFIPIFSRRGFIMFNQYHPCMNIWHYFDDCRCTMVYLPGVKRGNRESHFEPIFPLKHIKTPFTDESLVGGLEFCFFFHMLGIMIPTDELIFFSEG